MGGYAAKRILSMFITLFCGYIDFCYDALNSGKSVYRRKKLPPAIETLMEKYNLDQPLSKQYVDTMCQGLQEEISVHQ